MIQMILNVFVNQEAAVWGRGWVVIATLVYGDDGIFPQ